MKAVLVTEEELARLQIPAHRPGPRIIVSVERSVIRGYSTNGHGIEVTILDYDETFDTVTQPDGSETQAGVIEPTGIYDPDWVNGPLVLDDDDDPTLRHY